MDRHNVQLQLMAQYAEWKKNIQFSDGQAEQLSPPLLLSVTEKYCQADTRVLVLGQETYGWEWSDKLRITHPRYVHDWTFQNISSMRDFLSNEDAIEGLCWGYREFTFAKYQPVAYRAPFWQAFREIQNWPTAGVMWGNVARANWLSVKAEENGNSILRAPEEVREALVEQQAGLLMAELRILKPHICLFFTGPYYDPLITGSLSECEFLPVNEYPRRQLAKLRHPLLPSASFRTYHPSYLSRSKKWEYIDAIRNLARSDR